MNLIFEEKDIKNFLSWIELNFSSVTWEGRYSQKFDQFLNYFLVSGQDCSQIIKKIAYLKEVTKSGPLISWFNWIENKLICYIFINYNYSIRDLSFLVNGQPRVVALVVRDFLIERFPQLTRAINEKFQIGDATSSNIELRFSDLEKNFQLNKNMRGASDDEIMTSIEITLFPDFDRLLALLERKNKNFDFDITKLKKSFLFHTQIKFFQELIFLFLVGGVIIFAMKATNKWYENYMVDKISIFESTFDWLDKTLTFANEEEEVVEIGFSSKELEELERIESQNIFDEKVLEGKNYEDESDVVVTDLENIPKDLDVADSKQSEYEENLKGGYRNYVQGGSKAFRVLMTSDESHLVKEKLLDLVKKYNAKRVDNVKPGTAIPGGMYFNLNVPTKSLKEFLMETNKVNESQIFESKARVGTPKGMSRVFIWVKSI